MAEKVNGTDAMIKFNMQGSLEVYCYAKSFEMSIDSEMIPVSTIGDGAYKRFKPKRHSSTITMDALFLVTDSAPLNSSPIFLEQQLAMIETPFEILYTGETGGILSIRGRCWIQNMTFSAIPNGFVSKNVSLQVSGGLLRSDVAAGVIDLTMEVIASPGAVAMDNVRIVDFIGNETVVFAGTIGNGLSETVSIPAGTYHIRADLSSDRPYNLFYSDAAPGFSVPVSGPISSYEYWPYPPNSPIFDFTANRYLRWQGSDTPIS